MKTIIALAAIAAAFVTIPAAAAEPGAPQAKQQNRMVTCNREATGKKGDERKAFMKQCLSGGNADGKTAAAAKKRGS